MMQLRKPHVHLSSMCFSVPGSEKSPILLKCLLFLDIEKQHQNNAEIRTNSVF